MWTEAIKNIFVPFLPVEKAITTPAVDVAVSMADQASAHLTIRALGIKHQVPYSVMPQFAGALASKLNQDEKHALADIGAHLDAKLKTVSFPHDVAIRQEPYQDLVEMAGLQGRMHDLAVIDAPLDAMAPQQSIFEELVFQTGRPVLVVPPGASTFSANRIVVAWDGGPRAARALNDAMPLLRSADHVELVSVTNEKSLAGTVPGTEMAQHLARHGIKVEVAALQMVKDAGTTLTDHAALVDARLIVAGAFAHSRWRQLVLGGVTTSLVRYGKLPVLMSH